MQVIQDIETGNYLFEGSFQNGGVECNWVYTTCTGRCNLIRYYPNKQLANSDLNTLERYNEKSGANKKLHIMEKEIEDIPLGIVINEYI